jgi:phosphoenolpyruvate carboxylase
VILEEVINRLLEHKSISKKHFFQIAKNLKINLVLTAHPTEVKRRTLIQKYTNVNDILEKFNNLRIFTEKNIEIETLSLEERLHEQITSIWKTDELKRSRPSPVEEAKWGLAVIEDSLWNAVPKICSRFDKSVYDYTGKHLPINFSPIEFGSWMGGDRDGNSNVTAKITEEVVLLSRWEAANLYEKELTKLIQSLSMHECSVALRNKVGNDMEPYRTFLRPIRNKIKSTQKEIGLYLNEKKPLNKSLMVQSINEIIEPLIIVYNSLCTIKCKPIADGSVLDLLRRAHTFGLNLAKLDIRQESSRHKKLIINICKKLGLGDYTKWSEEEKIYFLSKKYQSKRPLIPGNMSLDKEDSEVWSTFKLI